VVSVRDNIKAPSIPIRNVRIEIQTNAANPPNGTTNTRGLVKIQWAGRADTYRVWVDPLNTPEDVSDADVGPATALPTTGHRFHRFYDFKITVDDDGNLTSVDGSSPEMALDEYGTVTMSGNNRLNITLKTLAIPSPNHSARPNNTDISLIVIHCTGGAVIGPALNRFAARGGGASAHYVIDTDGSIIKMVNDDRRAWHAGRSRWHNIAHVNNFSIGIEIVNRGFSHKQYTEEQYLSLIGLLHRLRDAHPNIPLYGIVGHSDVALDSSMNLGKPRPGDPGRIFNWERLESLGLGIVVPDDITNDDFDLSMIYDGFFADNEGGILSSGSSRAAIKELQNDLRSIGYHVGASDGEYGAKTEGGVKMFQVHFSQDPAGDDSVRTNRYDGKVDLRTALCLKRIIVKLTGFWPDGSKYT